MGKDIDTTARTHRFIDKDLAYIKNMDLDSFEVYDLANDLSQRQDIAGEVLAREPELADQLREFLRIIQADGPLIEGLPAEAGKPG